MSHIAFLGTGLLGAALASAAKARGEDVVVWNRSHEKAAALEKEGIRVAATAGDAVTDATRVHLVLRDDSVVDEVLASCGERLKGSVIVDHTTNGPAGTKQRAADLVEQGIDYLCAPVFMGPAAARAAKGAIVVSGPPKLYGQVKDALAQMTGHVEYLGERIELAAVYKLLGNSLFLSMTAALADSFALARAQGVTPLEMSKMFEYINPGAGLKARAKSMAEGDFSPSFELQMARKDVRLMIEAASDGEVPLQLLPVICSWMDRLIHEGLGHQDYGALAYEAVVGREPPPPSRAKLNTSD